MPDTLYAGVDCICERRQIIQLTVAGDAYHNSGWNYLSSRLSARL